MKPTSLLRLASVLALLQFTAHTGLFTSYAPVHGAAEVAVVEAMKSHHFAFQGFSRSYWDFYFGYGLLSAFTCLIEAVLFWKLAMLARKNGSVIRSVIALFCLANIGFAAFCWKFFIVTPIVLDVLIAACLGLAFVGLRRSEPNESYRASNEAGRFAAMGTASLPH
jgi:hypothetical protein